MSASGTKRTNSRDALTPAFDPKRTQGPRMTTKRSASTSCGVRCSHRRGKLPRTPVRTAQWSQARYSNSSNYAFGYNAQTGQYGDLVKQGVIDPAKVVRTALQDAASVAGLLVTTEAMVAEKPKLKTPPMPHGGGMGDMDY